MANSTVKSLSSLQKGENPVLASIKEKFNSNVNSSNMLANFQPASLYAPKNGKWLIQWYNRHPYTDQLQRVQKTFSINRIKNKKERRRVANEHLYLLNTALKRGYNYFLHTLGLESVEDADNNQQMSIYTLVEKLLPNRIQGRKDRTQKTYRSYNNRFCEWLEQSGYEYLACKQFGYAHWLEFVNYKLNMGHSASNINHFAEYFKTTFDLAIKMKWLTANPLADYEKLKEIGSNKFETLTDQELQKVGAKLRAENMRFYIYTKFVALQFIRPYHIAFLKASDIDYQNNLIKINADSSKNSKASIKQLIPELKNLLIEYKYHLLPADHYIFSANFLPSEKQYKSLSTRASELWRRLIILGLKIDKKMYALKHTAGQYYLNNNSHIDAAWLQHQMEHSSLAETQTYIAKRQLKRIDTDTIKLIRY